MMSAEEFSSLKGHFEGPERVGLKGEPQVKSSTRHTGIHTGKGRTSYKPQLENSRYIWY